jgi:CheY-like chemotaxis protein/anti-sigma regulatory factor (Ser/Thr protein kinase)
MPERVVGDPNRMRQVLRKLAGNAVKFTESGSVSVCVEPEVSIVPDAVPSSTRMFHFEVRDTGIGIPTEKQALVFEPFRQVDGSASRRYGGAGLGLSICRRLVSLMGGRIWAESEPGVGSTFHFTVAMAVGTAVLAQIRPAPPAIAPVPLAAPVGVTAPAPQAAPAAQPRAHARLRVLVAEDNMVNQTLIKRVLETAGCTVVCAPDGREAVKAYDAGGFDLILMDLQMPNMDGFEATAEVRRREAVSGSHIPIIAVTANALLGDRERCLAAGMDGYVTKPMKRPELFRAIAATVEFDVAAAS